MAGFSSSSKHLIIVVIPDDSYYRKSLASIQEFVREMAEGTRGLDDLLVLYPRSLEKKEAQLPFGDKTLHLVVEESPDLWVRDYGLVTPEGQIKFSYRPKYLKSKDAKYVEMEFTKLLGKLDICVKKSDIVLDGGNVVGNNKNKVIISERILTENKGKSKTSLKVELENLFNSKVVFIPDPEDTTGHSDGLVSFIEDNVLLIGDYQDLEYYNAIEMAVKSEFPDLKIVKLPCGVHDGGSSDKKWKGFSKATGSYVNALVTNNAVYVPQFGSPVDDARALEIIKMNTSKAVVPIDTSKLSHMGGSVRCMSWQIESSHSIAQILYKHCKSNS